MTSYFGSYPEDHGAAWTSEGCPVECHDWEACLPQTCGRGRRPGQQTDSIGFLSQGRLGPQRPHPGRLSAQSCSPAYCTAEHSKKRMDQCWLGHAWWTGQMTRATNVMCDTNPRQPCLFGQPGKGAGSSTLADAPCTTMSCNLCAILTQAPPLLHEIVKVLAERMYYRTSGAQRGTLGYGLMAHETIGH